MTTHKGYLYEAVNVHPGELKKRGQISPTEFLEWAKTDLRTSSKRERGNAIGNIKKAIHARLDEIIERTHLRFTNDWNPTEIRTAKKLEVIRKLGIGHREIVDVITASRNDFEHSYILPSHKDVKLHLSTCELWLNDNYDKWDFDPIGIAGLPLLGMGTDSTDKETRFTHLRFGSPERVLYFWDGKRALVTVERNGVVSEKPYRNFTSKEMLNLEAPLIKKCLKASGTTAVGRKALTRLYNCYRKWLQTHLATGS